MSRYRNSIYEWEGDSTQPFPSNFTFMSGRILLPKRVTFSVMRVIADTGDRQDYYDLLEERRLAIDRNSARISHLFMGNSISEKEIGYEIEINGDNLEDVPTVGEYSGDFNLTAYVYGDDTLLYTKEIYSNNKPFRIEGGIRARAWEIQVVGNVKVRRVDMAASMDELKGIQQVGEE